MDSSDLFIEQEAESYPLQPLLEPLAYLPGGSTGVRVNREGNNLDAAPPSFEDSQAAAAAAATTARARAETTPSNFNFAYLSFKSGRPERPQIRSHKFSDQENKVIGAFISTTWSKGIGTEERFRDADLIKLRNYDPSLLGDYELWPSQPLPSPLSWSDWILMSFEKDKSDRLKMFGDFPFGFVRELRYVFLDTGELQRYNLTGKTLETKMSL
ncbi:hypothetical protein PpBr36_02719 [Pyricularia pennisetigena]|uniref:hypothetical protein n=1 Tax=Pyricularia pennisetigena TaxID=1578925 RepID=UPI00114F7ED3|nr:hypothetical protein PpBr36_02719 [Pyricularia pennisetigena]TLS30554.1 hypothetical protein PpBr36_02719 [Pyricularia pennisetigena]